MPTTTAMRKKEVTGVFQMAAVWAMYLLFFLIPIFFLPWTTNVLEQNKQMLFVVLAVVGLAAWFGQMVISKKLVFRSGWLNLVPALFFVAVLVSSILSVSGYRTWVGDASQEYTSFLSLAMFVFLFYMLMNIAYDTLVQRNILFALLLSSAITGLITLSSMLGLFYLPFDFAQAIGFNTIGTINGFITFMTAVMFVGFAMWLVSNKGRDRVIPEGGLGVAMRIFIIVVALINLVTLVSVDFWLFWVINIIGVLLLGTFVFIQSQEFPNPKRFALPLIILFVSVVLLFLPTPFQLSVPIVVSPSFGTSWDIATTTVGAETSNLLFGSGPGTFLYDYLAYKPADVNNSQLWMLRFDRAKSAALTTFATLGVVGTVLWLVLMFWIGVKAVGRLVFERDHEEWKMTYVMFSGWAVLFISHLLYSSNFTMQFMLWGFSGLLASQVMVKFWKTDFARAPKLGLATSFAFVVVAIALLGSLFVTGQRYAAEVTFAKALELDQGGADVSYVVSALEEAVSLNGFNDSYQRNLASAYLVQAQNVVSSATAELTTEQTQEVVDIVSKAIGSASAATRIEPNYVSNWVMLGSIYRDLMSFAQGAEDLAAQMFMNAIQLEPTNPTHRTNLGRVYLTVADRARALRNAEDVELATTAAEQEAGLLLVAEEAFTGAVELKSDYLPAHYYLAAVYERQGQLEQAAVRLAALRNNNLADIGVAFQLSQMLIRLGEYESATTELERIVELDPSYSNALWYLASLYEISGETYEALRLVEQVVQYNPGNEVAQNRLERMKAGEVTTVIPEPIQSGQGATTEIDTGEIVEEPAQEVDGEIEEGENTELEESGEEPVAETEETPVQE